MTESYCCNMFSGTEVKDSMFPSEGVFLENNSPPQACFSYKLLAEVSHV